MLKARSISGSLPTREIASTLALCSRAKARGQRSPSLQLPHQIRRLLSIRQLHSIDNVHSPRGEPGCPSRFLVEVKVAELKEDCRPIFLPIRGLLAAHQRTGERLKPFVVEYVL
jgi:hypothetical protein